MSPDQAHPEPKSDVASATSRADDETKRLPLFLRRAPRRFGMLTDRLSPPFRLLCILTFLAGAVGWVLIAFSFLGLRSPITDGTDLAGAVVLAMAGVLAQYRLVLHRRAMRAQEEFPDPRHPEATSAYVALPDTARRRPHPMIRPLEKLRAAMGERLRRLHGHAGDHLRRFPTTDILTPAEALTCLIFAGLGAWGAVHIAAFCYAPPIVVDFKGLAGACTAVVMGAFLTFRLLLFVFLKVRSQTVANTPRAGESRPEDPAGEQDGDPRERM